MLLYCLVSVLDIWLFNMLKLDGRTVRGRVWKELQNSGKPLKQGVLLSKKMCSYCNQTPDDFDTDVIECMTCHLQFHTTCLVQPVSEAFVTTVSENPSIWWHCLSCMSCKSNDGVTLPSPESDCQRSTSDVIMQSTLLTFKKDVLTLVGETMDKKLRSFSELFDKAHKSSGNNSAQSMNPPAQSSQPSWADMTAASINSTTTNVDVSEKTNSSQSRRPDEVTWPRKTSEKHVLLLEPLKSEVMSTVDAKKKSLRSINDAISGVNVEFCSVRKSGIVAIGFKNSDAKKQAEEQLKKDDCCSSTFLSRDPKKLVPKITVTGINEVLFESCNKEDNDGMKKILLDDILNRNCNLKTLTESSKDEFLSVVMIQKVMPNAHTVSYTAALKMSSKVRKMIYDNDNKLYISLNRCKVYDRYHIKQCYHCQRHGHLSDNCPSKEEKQSPSCFYCSGDHRSKDCPDKKKLCCINCIKSNHPAIVKGASSHSAASSQCPILKSHINSLKEKTENWMGKNPT